MHTTIGKIPFGKYELNVRAIAGELAGHERKTFFRIPLRDTASIRVGEQIRRVCVASGANVPMRIGHRVTAYYAGLAGRDDWHLVAFSDDSAHKVHDLSESARLPGANRRVIWLAPLAAFGIAQFSQAIFPWIAHVAATMSVNPATAAYAYVACTWGSAIAFVAYLLRKSQAAKRNATQWRTNLLQFIESTAAGATHG
jgi:hypothetical protein